MNWSVSPELLKQIAIVSILLSGLIGALLGWGSGDDKRIIEEVADAEAEIAATPTFAREGGS